MTQVEQAILATFGRFVSPRVVERLLADPAGVRLGGMQQAITVLFADLRGYTSLAERLQEMARGGEIVVADSTQQALAAVAWFEPRGLTAIRGHSQQVAVYALLGLDDGQHSLRSPDAQDGSGKGRRHDPVGG
jgi:class 3 adenylate cyclase